MSKRNKTAIAPANAAKPFPWKCGYCGARAVACAVVNYTTNIDHDGRVHSVTVPDLELPRCEKCGDMVLDDAANRRISDTFRQQVGLLTPAEIRENREGLSLTQKQLASLLGIADATLSRWETGGQIQQRALDKLLRLFFDLPVVRTTLSKDSKRRRLAARA